MALTDSDLNSVELSVVVVAYDIVRELPRTLLSLSVGYQRGVTAADYEVIVVDNGSSPAVDPAIFRELVGQFRLLRIEDASASPAHAVNVGLQEARGDMVGVMVDGARLASPGFVRFALAGSHISPRSAVVTLGWHLGYDFQRYALQSGWTRADEDRLLESIDWPNDGYRLFEIATMAESSVDGWFEPLFESNALFLPASAWRDLGGYEERFDSAGGGLVNHDAFRRAADLDGLDWVILLGDATFHQVHDGIATNASPAQLAERIRNWTAQYQAIRQRDAEPVELRDPVLIGTLPEGLRPRYTYALSTLLQRQGRLLGPVVPPVPLPDPGAEGAGLAAQWMERATFAAHRGEPIEAMTFARWGRQAASDVGGAGPLLAHVAAHASVDRLPPAAFAQFHADAGLVCMRAGSLDKAAAHFAEALRVEPGNTDAYLGLSQIRMPGAGYREVLRWVHEELEPATYLEIGVANGASLALARPPTIAVGVDPAPAISQPIAVEYHVFPETSAEFFGRHDVQALLGGRPPSMVFIDGAHTLPTVLEDFWQVEAISGPDTFVVLHDTIPFDEITQRPERVYEFYTGDAWKLLHCFAETRADLSWVTVPTPPSGLTLVTGLDATSTVLRDRYDEWVERYGALTFDEVNVHPGPLIDNCREAVTEWLAQ
jgi:Glycosyl transferase family 2